MKSARSFLLCTAFSCGLYANAALAQQQPQPTADVVEQPAPDTGIGDIVVTAQKRSESVQKVPIAITAYSGAALQSKGVANLMDLTDITPGMRMISPGAGGTLTFSLRGVGQRDININNESPVAMYVDGSYISFSTVGAQPVYDVERVEVLKGPQGTLFGRNATGGLLHIVSERPSDKTSAYLKAEYGSYDSLQLQGALGGKIGGSWSARASFFVEHGGAYMINTVPGLPNHNGSYDYAGRLQLLYAPSDDFSLLLSASAVIWPDQAGPAPSSTRFMVDPVSGANIKPPSFAAYQAFCSALTGGLSVPTVPGPLGNCYTALSDPYHGGFNASGRFSNNYYNSSATLDWKFADNMTLTSITNYQLINNYNVNIPFDSVGAEIINYHHDQPKAYQLSQEVRVAGDFASGHWVTGLYGLYINNHGRNVTDLTNAPGYFIRLSTDFQQNTKSLAGFAEISYDLAPTWTVIVGGRITRDRKTVTNDTGCLTNPTVTAGGGPDICALIKGNNNPPLLAFNDYAGAFSKTSWSGRAVVQWKPSSDAMLYAGVNRGTKTGGFNAGGVQFYPLDQVQYKGETLYNYEAGFKTRLFDRRISFDGSVFYYDYKNYQTFTPGTDNALRTFNVDATIKGAETAIVARVIPGLEVRGSMTYLDTKQKNIPFVRPNGTVVFGDYPIADAPKFSADVSLRYGFKVGPGELSATISESHQSSRTISPVVFPDENIAAYDRVDLRFAYATDDGHWTAAFNIRNLTNEVIYTARVSFENLYGGVYNGIDKPRWYSGSLTYRF